ncbi:MAG TPA: hypothetical protein DEU95_15760 [Chloroflexi bacterium]|nr:hypothetical protein [Chloroflexota bacterium]
MSHIAVCIIGRLTLPAFEPLNAISVTPPDAYRRYHVGMNSSRRVSLAPVEITRDRVPRKHTSGVADELNVEG